MKQYLKFVLHALVVELLTAPLRGYVSFKVSAVVGFVLFFLLIYYLLKKNATKHRQLHLLFAVLLGCCLVQIPARIFFLLSPESALISLPDFLFHLFGIVLGYFFFRTRKVLKYLIVAVSLVSCCYIYFKGYSDWLNKSRFAPFSGFQYKPIIDGEGK